MDRETRTRLFLNRVLKEHYRYLEQHTLETRSAWLPPRFTLREFAFIYPGGKGMHRPVSFESQGELISFLRDKLPIHAYYSTAYYSNPQAPMKDKEWLGADLVFDLDADHIPGGAEMSYRDQLELVRKKTQMLLDDFLLDDFGFDPVDVALYFSGHRGYHIHVRKGKVLTMSRHSRRELVDYITGRGLDFDIILPSTDIQVDEFMGHKKYVTSHVLPSEDSGGWMGRVREMTMGLFQRWSEMPREDVMKEMMEKHNMGIKRSKELYRELFEGGKWHTITENGNLDTLSESGGAGVKWIIEIIRGIIDEENIKEIGDSVLGATDEPVTGDIKRLIRLPMSVHGGSFLYTTPVPTGELEEFDPLRDAVPPMLGDGEIHLILDRLPREESITVRGKEFIMEEEMCVPEFAAAHIVSKYKAKLL